MTAEIAILNKSAVALAADSAVTIGSGRGQKIFNTGNKLFALAKHQAVAVMVYGSAEIMQVPWETIIKVYRKKLGSRSFPHLEDYATDFLSFLGRNRTLFPPSAQGEYFKALVSALYHRINEDVQTAAKKQVEKSGSVTISETRQIVHDQIAKHFNHLRTCKNLHRIRDAFGVNLVRKFSGVLKQLRERFFQKLPVSPADLAKLRKMSGWLFVRDSPRVQGDSGMVIAGFGGRDIYPRLTEFVVKGVIQDRLCYRPQRHVQIGVKMDASIVPFAQSEVVRSFIDGMDPGMESFLNKFLDDVFANYPGLLVKHFPNLTTSEKAKATKKTKAVSIEILRKLREEIEEIRRKMLVNPILSTVEVLPKDELAAMAEALVSLTSIKRRFSLDAETVGGPVDVAVISKGDGLIWIKRKHYFKPELNPQFLTNYCAKA